MNDTLKKIMGANDTKTERITIAEWDDAVLIIKEPVRSVFTRLQEQYLKLDPVTQRAGEGSDMDSFGNALLMEMLFDENDTKIFDNVEQVKTVLDAKSVRIQKRLLDACTAIMEDPTEASVKAAEGNSEAIQS